MNLNTRHCLPVFGFAERLARAPYFVQDVLLFPLMKPRAVSVTGKEGLAWEDTDGGTD